MSECGLTAHAAEYMLEVVRTIVEVDVASFDSSLLADSVSSSIRRYQGQVVAQPVVEGQVRSGFPGILGKRAEHTTGACLLVYVGSESGDGDVDKE
jgi:hypothetical protein